MCLQMFPGSCSNKMNLLCLSDNVELLHAMQCHILDFNIFPGGGCCVGTGGTSCSLQSEGRPRTFSKEDSFGISFDNYHKVIICD